MLDFFFLELELQVVMSHLTWVLGIKLRSSTENSQHSSSLTSHFRNGIDYGKKIDIFYMSIVYFFHICSITLSCVFPAAHVGLLPPLKHYPFHFCVI